MSKNSIVKRSKEEVANLLHEWEQSKLSKRNFCNQKGINYQTFIGWTLKNQNKSKLSEKKFIPLQIEEGNQSMFAEIHLSGIKKIILYQPMGVEFFQAVLKC